MGTGRLESKKLYTLSWVTILFAIAIIAWGSWVRISGSGDGCGDHWPLCNGQAIPLGAATKTWTEVLHRYSTAIFGLLVLLQLFLIRKGTAASSPARFWIWCTLLCTATEALVGRMLVKQGLVNESQSLYRLVVMPLHLVNTSLLLFCQVMTAESIAFGARKRISLSSKQRGVLTLCMVFLVSLLTTGAVAALGSHLLPAVSLRDGLIQDLNLESHPAVRLRIIHPILGLLIPTGTWLALWNLSQPSRNHQLLTMYRRFALCFVVAMLIGTLTLSLLAPTWLKLVHLTMANVLVVLASRCTFHTLRPAGTE